MFALPVAAALLLLLIVRAFVPRRRPGARGRVRSTVLATLGMAGLMVVPAAAWASPPYHGTFSSHEVFVDSEVCAPEGFSVDVVQDEVLAFRVFFAPSGAVAFVAVHVDYRAVISANGHTIVERDTWMDTYYPDGSARTVGNTVHIQGQGPGLVQHDAGQIVFVDGSVQAIHGPHPQFEGQSFCFALLP
ncbi:hypothetical protein FHX52_4347 [Humibacillus xanthopallidus]|uniref:Uncharacterized protein n=2 Tax=Humibacillus xanthopallidus TaxID=412689 RepID=A0A543PM21_9MICO|nr:hypothetical protein FHX52_4347 [Humibacillus xanthopallidus]